MSFLHISLASSSRGNAHLISSDEGKTFIFMDCGISDSYLKRKLFDLNISLNQIKGAVITHFHGDHIKGIKTLLPYMPVYSSKGTFDQLDFDDVNLIRVKAGKSFKTDTGLIFIGFDVFHNDIEPFNFIFKNSIGEYGIYITDTSQVKLNIKNIRPTLILIEANFDEEVMKQQLKESEKIIKRDRGYETVMKQRQLSDVGGHLSVQKAIKILKGFKLGLCKYIILIHLSPTNSFDYFADMVSEAFDNKIPVKQLAQFKTEITIIENKKEGIKLDF
jgi:phosphoribosyl 1,2-cyclic phosphodiesterase